MAALGIFIVYLIYAILAGLTIFSLFQFKKNKKSALLSFVIFLSLLIWYSYTQHQHKKSNQLSEVGVYDLTNYPNCPKCKIELSENLTFKVINESEVLEKGRWNYELGGDYSTTHLYSHRYLKKDEQLGYGRFEYKKYQLRYQSD
jgi:hypothetical protein